MDISTRLAWIVLALIHLSPAMVLFVPGMTEKLYGIPPDGAAGILIVHRGALFLAILIACLLALIQSEARRALSIVVGISVIGYLVVYVRAGLPSGPLRTIAIADAIALIPLVWVTWRAWRAPL